MFFVQNSAVIKSACKKLSHKRKGSKNRQKAVLTLARLYRKTFNQRHNFHFKLARQLCLVYETICIEYLNIKEMQRLYGKKIGDLAFSEFVNILKYTATKFGVKVIEVDRYFASSQIYHCCGYKNPEVKDLNVREWVCPNCETKHDQNRNAAKNILNFGFGHQPLQ